MSVTTRQATVYVATTAGRCFLTKRAAINKEARAIILKHFPSERGCRGEIDGCGPGGCGDRGWSLEIDEPDRFLRYYKKIVAALSKTMKP